MEDHSTITELVIQGLTPEQIADTLQQPIEEVNKVISKDYGDENDIDKLYERHQVAAVKMLASVMRDSENDSARVSAAKVILSRGGNFTEDTMNRLKDRFSRMQVVCRNKYTTNVINVSESLKPVLNLE